LRSHLESLGISLRSATEPIDDTSIGKLMEGVLAAFAQFANDVRWNRTRAGMKEALRLGRWTFLAPLGYVNAPRAMRQSLMRDPERAAIVRRLFKQYATGTYTKQEILPKATQWGLTNRRGQPLTSQAIGMLRRNRMYIGIIDVPDFGIRDQRGDFDPLIREETFDEAEARATHLRCRFAKAPPVPDFRYFSNARARRSSENSTITSMIQGLPSEVWGTRPALCASSRIARFEVRPV